MDVNIYIYQLSLLNRWVDNAYISGSETNRVGRYGLDLSGPEQVVGCCED
jgi:hypothetical protein